MTIPVETEFGPISICLFISKEGNNKGRVLASVSDLHSRQPNWANGQGNPVPRLLVNGIPVWGTINLHADPEKDLTDPGLWSFGHSYVKRLDKQPWENNDATDNQYSKLRRMAENEVAKLFENPATLPLVKIGTKESEIKGLEKKVVAAEENLLNLSKELQRERNALESLRAGQDPKATNYDGGV